MKDSISIVNAATQNVLRAITIFLILVFSVSAGIVFGILLTNLTIASSIFLLTLIFILQSAFTLIWMLYAWEDPEEVKKDRSPEKFIKPQLSFSALLPARHEENVIADTITAINNINYPDSLKEIIILCRIDDDKTIQKVREIMNKFAKPNIRLQIFNGSPINKPHALNIGLDAAEKDVVVIFDAEDQPHPDIYNVANTVMIRDKADVLQSGVQLMNFKSKWFSALNCMEYFFWFKSGLHFFSKIGKATPLGGNTVFFKTKYLKKINGWDENCLTEDADVGFRLVGAGAKVRVIYDEMHATREETPTTISEFIKQRTRWNQGFLQILAKGSWAKLPTLKQQIVSLYILLSPIMQSLMLLYIPFAIWVAFNVKMPVVISLFSFVPFLLLGLQISTNIIGLYEFTKAYKLKFPIYMPFVILITYFPYQLLLMFSAFRALIRFILSKNSWEKTLHINAHRQIKPTYA